MEPLAVFINGNSSNEGWSIARITEKLSLYVDDKLVYLADPKASLKSLFDTVDEFGSYLHLKINWAKLVLYPVDDLSTLGISAKCRL